MLHKDELSTVVQPDCTGENTTVGPIESGTDRNGNPLYAFERSPDFAKLRLNYTTTKLPAKRYFLPYREDLASFRLEGDDWRKNIDYNIDRPYVFFGLHACDINALNKLDKVLMGSVYPMPYYAAKRTNMFIIGIDCSAPAVLLLPIHGHPTA